MSGSSRIVLCTALLAAMLTTPAAMGQDPRQPSAPATQTQGQPPQGQQSQGQPPPEPQPQAAQAPVFRAEINFVRVDVTVTDKSGNPAANLQANDFDVS